MFFYLLHEHFNHEHQTPQLLTLLSLGIALYRALLVQCPRITLPPDTTVGPINAIQHQIRKGFRKNVNQTVPRYIVAALENGYQVGL
jgi:hypothetical protein